LEIGRGFLYASDEFYIVAGREIPPAGEYDGFPQMENGVGIVRSFLEDFRRESGSFPKRLPSRRRLTLVTAELASGFLREIILPRLAQVGNLEVKLVVAPNVLFGPSVTVAGLLSGKCIYSSLKEEQCGDLVLLPPEVLNPDGMFLDDTTLLRLEQDIGSPALVFEGSWKEVFRTLTRHEEKTDRTLLRMESMDGG
jgi:NifB/MoaA-like Fe-S oxidoreductase